MPDAAPPLKQGAPPGEAGATGTPLEPQPAPGTVTITVDGRPVAARKGEMLIAAAERAGTYIPRFCYHPRMKPVGMCRMCLVEVKGPRGFSLSPACYLPVVEGMEAVTESPAVKKAQDGVLEFLLANHPLDCPVCDKGGECPLQDQTVAYGPGETRFVEEKRHWDKPVPLSSLVLIDRERCIQCARCTRFAEEIAGDAGIDFASRSDSTEVAIYPGQPFVSNFSGNVVQICPVGALLAKPYRFKARPWDLEQVETTCTLCAVGCRVAAQSSSDEVVRFIGVDSDPVNRGWLCDKGRFGFEALNSPERLTHPLARPAGAGDGGRRPPLAEVSWASAFSEIVSHLDGVAGERIGVIGGARLPNEDAYAWAKLARTVLHTDNVDAQLGDGLPADLLEGLPRATIDQVCAAPVIVTIAPDIKEELPVLYLRLRDAVVERGARLIEVSPAATGLTSRATQSLRYRPGELAALAGALCGGTPVTSAIGGVGAEEVEQARLAIVGATVGDPRLAVVLGRPSLAEPPTGVAAAALAMAALPGVVFLSALRRSNVHGALDSGLAPGLLPGRVGLADGREWFERRWGAPLPERKGLDTTGMLTAAAEGRLDVLFLLGADPLSDCPDRELARRALEATPFVVAVDAFAGPSAANADVVLPAAIYTERRGSFTNLEGRVSWLAQKVTPPGTARPDWMIAVELASRLGADLGPASLQGLWDEMEELSPLHRGVSKALLSSSSGRDGSWDRDGVVVPVKAGASSAAPLLGPGPLDPMAGPGIASAEIHTVPPVRPPAADRAHGSQAAGHEDEPGLPPMLRVPPSGTRGATKPGATKPGPTKTAASPLRLVTTRPMWDGGVLIQRSPSLAGLHPGTVLRLNPEDLARAGAAAGERVRVSAGRGSIVAVAVSDPDVRAGTAVLPFNLPDAETGNLIDAAAEITEVAVEALGTDAPAAGAAATGTGTEP